MDMAKGFFFSLPSDSVNRTLLPLVDQLCAEHYQISYYNTADFRYRIKNNARFTAYPDYTNGYRTNNIAPDISYFQFADILLETSISVLDFICAEVEREKPDFILHSHLAPWGKMVARHFNLPAVSLFSTFVLDKKIMLPCLKDNKPADREGTGNGVQDAMQLYRKLLTLYTQLQIKETPDIWDLYVNREALNISFIHPIFQPQIALLEHGYNFVGFHMQTVMTKTAANIIYVSMGTVMNKDLLLFTKIIRALGKFKQLCIVSLGNSIKISDLGDIPPHVQLHTYVDQVEVLKKSAVFITRGGMASVQEALCALTPMIVIPDIPEQRLTAEKIEEVEIGLNLGHKPDADSLELAINQVLSGQHKFSAALRKVNALMTTKSPCQTASGLISEYLDQSACCAGYHLNPTNQS